MANLTIRSGNPNLPARPTAEAEWAPLRMMRDLLRWDPFREMAPVLSEEQGLGFIPAFEVKESADGYTFKADLPGVRPEDLDITVTGNRLSVSGKREGEKEEQGETYYTYERSYGKFARAFTLPESADCNQVTADLRDGVLTIVLPKKPEMQARKVSLNPAATKA